METDTRQPLCVFCIAASFYPAAYIQVTNGSAEDIIVNEVAGLDPAFTLKAKATTNLNLMSGNPPMFVAFLRFLGNKSYVRYYINQTPANPFAEFEYFGTKVCAAHLHDAIDAWNRRHDPRNRIAGY